MTIILRLQGLDVKAGAEDIRAFFKCLHIPDGGVYIVGGSLGEAFLAFTTDRDAQLAMRYTGNFLKGSKVTLHISSMEELEHKLKSLLKKKKPLSTQLPVRGPQQSPDAKLLPLNAGPHTTNTANLSPSTAWALDSNIANLPQPHHPNASDLQAPNELDTNTAFLLGVCTVLQGLHSSHQGTNNEAVPRVDFPKTESTAVPNELKTAEQTLDSKPGYVRLFGLPASTTKEVICRFFKGLTVQEAIVNVKLGLGHGCLVKFASVQEACDALLFNQQSLGPFCVEVRGADEKMWTGALQECESTFDVGERVKPKQRTFRETAKEKRQSTALRRNRESATLWPFKSPKKPRPADDSTPALSPTIEYTIMVRNIPKTMTKTEIKTLFGCPNIAHKNVLHLLDKEGNRTDTAFLIFNCTEDYDNAMSLTGCHVGPKAIEVSSITRMMMRDMMAKTHPRSIEPDAKKKPKRKKKYRVETPEAPSMNTDP